MIPFIILAGGLATRLKPLTDKIPKALIPVANSPFIYHQLELLNSRGVTHVILCVGHLGYMIQQQIGDEYKNIKIDYSYDGDKLLGTGGAIKKATHKVDKFFGVLYGDSYLPINYQEVIEHFNGTVNGNGLMTVYKNDNKFDKSNVLVKDGKVIKYDKSGLDSSMVHIDYGFSILPKSEFDGFDANVSFDLSIVMNRLIEKNQLISYEIFERFYEIGTLKGLADLELKLQSR